MMTTATDELTTTKVEEAMPIVRKYMYWSMGAGAIPFPIVDVIGMMSVHLKMVRELADLYEIDYSEQRAKSITSSLISSLSAKVLSTYALTSVLKALPGPTSLFAIASQPIAAGALEYALGKVFIQHFEAGGTILDFKPDKVKLFFREKFEEGKKFAGKMKSEKGKDATEDQTEEDTTVAEEKATAPTSKSTTKKTTGRSTAK